MALWTCFLSLLLLLTTATRAELIQHIAAAELVDSGHAIPHDRCSVDFFHHNESYTEDDDETHKQYQFNASDAYFFLSWTTLNDDKLSEIVGNIYNVRNPYLPIGDLNNSFLPILSHNNAQSYNQNYHYISTSDFQSKPNDIVFSFYNENSIQIRVFGATKSHFNRDSFLWSPQIPIMGKKINDSKYDIIHQNIQCIDGNTTEFIIFVYESKYWINNTEYTNIYKSSFNNKYVVSNDKKPINNIQGSISYPLVYQSSLSQNVIIAYIANHVSIAYKFYSIAGNDKLVQFGNESVIVSVATPETIKYYNIIPLSVGGYMLMYTSNYNAIYILLMGENGDKLFADTFIGYESNNTDSHGQIIELSQISDTETYVFITFDIFEGNRHKLVGVVYHININTDTFMHVIGGDMIELNSFPDIDIDEDAVHPNFICANYDIKSKMIVVGWISNYHQFVYKPFYFHLPVNDEILSTETSEEEEEEIFSSTMLRWTATPNVSLGGDAERNELLKDGELSNDMEIVVIVLCVSGFYCLLIVGVTFGIIYMVNTGKLRFAIGYKHIHKQNNKKNKNGFDEESDDDGEDLELGDDDKGGMFADDEQTADEEESDINHVKKKKIKESEAKSKVEMLTLVEESD